MKTDTELQQDIIAELKWEPGIQAAEIGVGVKDGVVTLSGVVDTYSKKYAVERATKRVAGVKAIAEAITVNLPGTYKRADGDIAESATNVITLNLLVPKNRVEVMTQDGMIKLSGEVDWQFEKKAAEDAVRHLIGVVGVINEIRIKPKAKTVDASEVRKEIGDALKRNAMLLRDAEKIQVEVSGSKVILTGSVGSWADREEAEYTAYCAPGVSDVENRLNLKLRTD